ncbi:hypothetical protein ACIPQ1_00880 [Pseudomonas sp. LARHCG127]|uniref:hypothetical protein n=1 Tax=unclassified Pseudomonas TaxID=196821 RepID=UPI0039855890
MVDFVHRALGVPGIRPTPVRIGYQPAHGVCAQFIAADAHLPGSSDHSHQGLF